MTCLMRANVGEIVRTPHGRELFLDQLQCGAAIAAANGHAPSEAFMKSRQETFSERDSQYATSMLRDVERGGATEVEHILGFMLNKASKANIAHRTLLLAYTHIKAFEQRRAAGGCPDLAYGQASRPLGLMINCRPDVRNRECRPQE
jgi:2-dehydropantoate 2-reductase